MIPRAKIVYSPHCFAFERQDVGRVVREIFRVVERALARRTRSVVALSRREAGLARSLWSRLDVVEARNVDDVPPEYRGVANAPRPTGPFVVAASGRLCPQKDPSFFADVVRAAGFDARWIWIGDGEERYRAELESAGVEVTGWSDRAAVLQTLSESHVCLHTAAWETGVPIAVLEAAALGIPVVARAIPANAGTDVARLVADPSAAAQEIARLASPERWEEESARARAALEALLEEKSLADGLSQAYGLAPVERRKLLTSVA